MAPFSSWNVGNDDAVVAVRVAYFKVNKHGQKVMKSLSIFSSLPITLFSLRFAQTN